MLGDTTGPGKTNGEAVGGGRGLARGYWSSRTPERHFLCEESAELFLQLMKSAALNLCCTATWNNNEKLIRRKRATTYVP